MELRLDTDWTYHGLRLIILDNGLLRVEIMPEAGAKIWQITYNPNAEQLLWNNPRIPPARHAIHSRYDDVWSGGWDELFPVDEEATILGERYPDHGELWTGKWRAEPYSTTDEVGVLLKFRTPISAIAVEKKIRLCRNSSRLRFEYRFTNIGQQTFPFLWKLHPAFRITEHHRVDFPPMRVVREPAFEGSLSGAPLEFTWPYAHTSAGKIDLRRIPREAEQQLYFIYGAEMQGGWCALTNTETNLACGLRFDPDIFPSCWLFASYGGWRSLNVAVLEPCTGYPLNFDSLVAAGRERTLAPSETLSTQVLFSVQEGLNSVSNVDAEGLMVEEGVEQFSR